MPRKRRNPFGDLAHFNPFAQRGESRNYRKNEDTEACPVKPKRPSSGAPRGGSSSRGFCADRPRHVFTECFSTTNKKGKSAIKEARAFLEFEVPNMTSEECARNDERINFAKELVARADKRNRNRQLRRSGKTSASGSSAKPGAPPPPPAPKKEAVHYEELSGPNGETIRFKLTYENGKFKKRVRAKEEPPIGAVILDLTSGVKAWKRFSDKRRSIPLTPSMKKSYESSFLYKVREFGAGKITFQQLADKIVAAKKTQGKASGVVFKKLRRKNRKKHK